MSRAERDVARMAPLVTAAAEHERRIVERARDLAARLSLRHGAAPQPQATTPGACARNAWKQAVREKSDGRGRKSTAGVWRELACRIHPTYT